MFSRSSFARWILACTLCLQLQHCPNAYRDFGNKGSDSYRINQTKKYMDDLDFDEAIANITPVLAHQPTNEDVVYLASAAHAGRAGLRILNMLTAIPTGIHDSGLLKIFADNMPAMTDDKVADMETAVSIVETFSDDATKRSPSLNFYALMLYYARIGGILNRYAYDATSNDVTATFSACTVSDTDGLPDAQIDKIMITFPRIITTVAGVAGGGAGLDTVVSNDLNSLLGGIDIPTEPIPCSSVTGTATPEYVACLAVRTLMNKGHNNGGGIGLDTPGNDPTNPAGGVCVPVP